jgi:hypothetical protein
VLFKRKATRVTLEEMEDCRVIAISAYAVVDAAWLRSSETCGFCVYSFQGVCVLWVCIDLYW